MRRGSAVLAWTAVTLVAILSAAAVLGVLGTGALKNLGGTGCDDGSGCPAAGRSRLVLGDPATSGLDAWPGQFDVEPILVDLDGDGAKEIVAHSTDTNVYVFAATGRALAVLPTTYPDDWYIERVLNGVAAAPLRPGQPPSIVVANHAAYVTVWEVASTAGSSIRFEKAWERRMSDCHENPGMDAGASLADLNGDGVLEILVQTEEVGFYALRADGTLLWHQCWAGGNAAPVADDLDGDGRPEVVVGSDDGLLAVLEGATGKPLWTFNAAQHVRPGSISVEPTVAQLDGVGEKEVLFTVRDAPDPDPATWLDAHMAIFAVHRNPSTYQAELLWMRQPAWANPLSYTHLEVLDADGDGAMDILGMDWNTVGHKPGNWERLGPAHAFRLDAQGEDVWVRPLESWWSNKDIAIGDIDGDGRLDVLANAPGASGFDGFVALDIDSGETFSEIALPGWQVLRGAVLDDLHGDGRLHAVFPVSPTQATATMPAQAGGIVVHDLGPSAKSRGAA